MSTTHPSNPAIVVLTKNGAPTDIIARLTSVGSYPLFYLTTDDQPICPQCVEDNFPAILAREPGWELMRHVNWENPHLDCEHCGERIESAYAEDETSEDTAPEKEKSVEG